MLIHYVVLLLYVQRMVQVATWSRLVGLKLVRLHWVGLYTTPVCVWSTDVLCVCGAQTCCVCVEHRRVVCVEHRRVVCVQHRRVVCVGGGGGSPALGTL